MFDFQKYADEQIKALGFDPKKLTEAQRNILLQPSDAPENYHHDGEVTPQVASKIWQQKMIDAGFTRAEVLKAKSKYGI